MHATQPQARPWYREPWPWALMLGPALVVVAGAVTIAYAVSSYDGLVADDYYKRGLTVNRELARLQTARDLGVTAVLAAGATHVMASVTFAQPAAAPSSLTLRLAHPTRASEDIVVPLRRVESGKYVAPLALAGGVHWKVRLETSEWLLQGKIPAGSVKAVLSPAQE